MLSLSLSRLWLICSLLLSLSGGSFSFAGSFSLVGIGLSVGGLLTKMRGTRATSASTSKARRCTSPFSRQICRLDLASDSNTNIKSADQTVLHEWWKPEKVLRDNDESNSYEYDLWIVGAGVLGKETAKEWIKQNPTSRIVAETLTESSHDALREIGITPRLRSQRTERDKYSALNVLISFPPSASSDLASELRDACDLWVGSEIVEEVEIPNLGGILYTSSTVVYGEHATGPIQELSPVNGSTARSKR